FYPTSGSKGTSSLSYCIVEYIDCSLASGGEAYGSLDASGGTITLTNSIIRNCKSDYGGAIFIRSAAKLTLYKCTIENNSADIWGGGLYFGGSSGSITNCIVRNNSAPSGGGIYVYTGGPKIQNNLIYSNSSSGSGSGIFLNRANSALKIINTTCAKNNISGSVKDFQFSGLTGQLPKIINSIIWGSDIGTLDAAKITVTNSAIQGFSNVGDHTASISLSSDNDDPNGPNFNAIDGSDWSLTENSPLINKGLDNSSDPDVPLTDILGNPRYGTTDIGAYEFISLIYTWQGDDTANPTLWNDPDNWDSGIVPSGSEDIIIPSGLSNYPVGSTTQDYTIASGKQMTIESGSRVTLNNLTNNGTLKLNHNSSGFASLILNGYTRGTGGTEEIQLYLTGGGNPMIEDYKWHYISIPVSSLSASIFTATTLDLAQFIESRPSTSMLQGWVAYDGYIYSTGGTGGPTFSSLSPGKGYDFWDDSDNTFTFGGSLNTSNVTMSLGYSGMPSIHGFNLLGNPFSSGLDWDDIIEGVYFAYPANTSKSLYFTRDNTQCTYAAGVGIPSDVNGIIPPMQGFFTKTYATGNSITLPAAARTHNNIHSRYKGDEPIPLVRLAIFENTVSNDETVVRFDEAAKSDLDNDFDAVKMFLSDTKTTIHTSVGGVDYAINGLPFPETSVEIPVIVNVTTTGMHKISTTQLQGLDSYYIYLIDNLTSTELDLKDTPDLSFSAPAGKISDRFILKISTTPTGTEDPQVKPGQFIIYHGYDLINIQPLADDWAGMPASVRLMDMSGKSITDMQNVEFQRNSLVRMQAPKAKGMYFVEIRSGVRRYVGKVVVK
ncbi:MAG: right-handed parallel beta-helix repeat-containing protein, partial [Bacteroidales bacterium]|nr:right-handed parallel beta-helix repeat-containing protein [Bacteroidales bacterium]